MDKDGRRTADPSGAGSPSGSSPDGRGAGAPRKPGDPPVNSGPGRAAPAAYRPIPYGLIALVFVPAAAAYVWFLGAVQAFRFAHPWALLLIPMGVFLVLWAGLHRGATRRPVLVHSRAAELGGRTPGLWARLADLPLVLRVLGVVLLGVVLARPQSASPEADIDVEGIDIVLALDLSGSMAATDLLPTRLEAAKAVIRDFVRRRPTDRIGLVVFARDAYTHVPLTLDHGALLRMLGELQLEVIDGKGTAIGNGLGVSLARLRRSDARSKVIILLTDGDNNAGNITPSQAADMAQRLSVKIYTILAGDNESSDQPGVRGQPQQTFPVNPQLLEEIATKTGGVPYLATDTRALAERFQDILEDLEKSRIQERGILYTELYPRFLLPAVLVLLFELLLGFTRLRRLP